MNKSGIVRRVDDLGRIVIPKEIRKVLRIKEGDSLEISIFNTDVLLSKHSHIDEIKQLTLEICEAFYNVTKQSVIIVDKVKVVAFSKMNDKITDESLGEPFLNMLDENKELFVKSEVNLNDTVTLQASKGVIIKPLILFGDLLGAVIVLNNDLEISSVNSYINIISEIIVKNF